MSMPSRAEAAVGPEWEEERAMAAVLPDPPVEVLEATEDDLRVAVARALARCGCTFAELAEQARTGRFESLSARMAWVAVGDLGHLGGESGLRPS